MAPAAFKAPTRIAKIFVRFIARFFTAESILAMLLGGARTNTLLWSIAFKGEQSREKNTNS
jgi:hypothetical protein